MKKIVYLFIFLGFHLTAWSEECDKYDTPECFGVFWIGATTQDIQGVDVHLKEVDGCTPLHKASAFNINTEIIALLLDKEADIEARNKKGNTPLHSAANNNPNPEVITLLLAKGANAKAKDKSGKTALEIGQGNSSFVNTEQYQLLKEATK